MQFLYPSEADTHRLLRFLLDQLSQNPTTLGKGRSSGRRGRAGRIGVDDFGGSKISGTVRLALGLCWDEANSSGDGKENRFGVSKSDSGSRLSDSVGGGDDEAISWGVPFRTCPLRLSSARGTNKKQPPLITIQAKPRAYLVPSILEMNSRSAEKSARLAEAQLAQLARQADKTSLPGPKPKRKVISGGILLQYKELVSIPVIMEISPTVNGVERSHSVDAEGRKGMQSEAFAVKQQAEILKLEQGISTLTIQAEKVCEYRVGYIQKLPLLPAIPYVSGAELCSSCPHILFLCESQIQCWFFLSLNLFMWIYQMAGEVAAVERKGAELKQNKSSAVERADMLDHRRHLMKEAIDLAVDESSSPEAVLQELELTVNEGSERLQALETEW